MKGQFSCPFIFLLFTLLYKYIISRRLFNELFFFLLLYIFLIPTTYFEHISSSLYPIFKFLTSLCFLLCGYWGFKNSSASIEYSLPIIIGLFFGLLGDVAIILPISSSFILGALSFAIGHLFFIKAFTALNPLCKKDFFLITISFLIFALFIIKFKYFDFNNLLPVVLIYGLIILTMVIKSINLLGNNVLRKIQLYTIILGSVLFTISDFILLFVKFYPNCPEILNSLSLITYYTGQALIALSLS